MKRDAFLNARGAGGGKSGGGSGGIEETPDTLSSVAFARFIDLIGEGQIVGLVNNEYSIYLDGVPLKHLDGTSNYKPFRWAFRTGTQTQDPMPGFTGVEQENAVSLKILKSQGKVIRSISDADADAVRVTMSVNGLTQTDSKNGKILGSKVEFQISVRVDGGAWVPAITRETSRIEGKTGSRYQRSYEIPVATLGPGPYEVAVERLTDDSASALLVNDLYWDSFTVINTEKYSYPNTAVAGIELDARYFSNIPTRSYHVKGMLVRVPENYDPETRTYRTTGFGTTNGVWNGKWKIAYTNNPAWCFYDLVTNRRYGLGRRIKESQISKWELYSIAQYCDQRVPVLLNANVLEPVSSGGIGLGGKTIAGVPVAQGPMEPRFTLNCVINTKSEAYKVLNQIASVFRGMCYWASGSIMLTQDRPTPVSAEFTNANVKDAVFKSEGSSRKQRNTVALVGWNDPAEDFKQKFEYIEDREGIARYGVRNLEVAAFGCTSRGQARRTGLWMLYTQRLESEAISFTAGTEGASLRPGMVVRILDVDRAGSRWGGRLLAATTNQVTLDAPADLTAGTYTINVMTRENGVVSREVLIGADGSYDTLTVTQPFPQAPAGMAVWTMGSVDVQPILGRIVAVREASTTEYEVTCVEHNPSKYAAIEAGALAELPNYTSISFNKIPMVKNLKAVETTFRRDLESPVEIRVDVSWDAMTDPLIRGYVVKYIGTSGTLTALPEQRDPSVTLTGLAPDTYTINVYAVNTLGIAGEAASTGVVVSGVAAPPTDDSAPPPMEDLQATGEFSAIELSWKKASYDVGGGNFEIHIFGADYGGIGDLPQFWQATLRAKLPGLETRYTDNCGPGIRRHYWARFVSRAGVPQAQPTGGVNGVWAVTGQNIDGMLAALKGSITEAELYGDLGTQIRPFTGFTTWDFTNSVSGWTAVDAQLTPELNYISVASTGAAPKLISPVVDIQGARYDKIRMRLRRTAGAGWRGVVYGKDATGDFSDARQKTISDPTVLGQWSIVEWDMSTLTAGGDHWVTHTTTQLRIDLGASIEDAFDIDWISVGSRSPSVSGASVTEEREERIAGDQANASAITTVQARLAKTKNYNIVAKGWGIGMGSPKGLRDADTGEVVHGYTRSYMLVVFEAGVKVFGQFYDVFGMGNDPGNPTGYGRGPSHLAADLNACHAGQVVVVYTDDEPQGNRTLAGLPDALIRCGATRGALNSIKVRGAYILVGIPGVGEGGGIERLGGTVDNDPNAWAEYNLQFLNGRPVGLGGSPLAAAVQQEISTRVAETGHIAAKYTVRAEVTAGGRTVVGGFGLTGTSSPTEGPRIDFGVRADRFWVGAPAGSGVGDVIPFIVQTTTQVLNGQSFPPGVYMDSAYIRQLQAYQINTNGLTLKDASGNVILGAGVGLPSSYIRFGNGSNMLRNGDFKSGIAGWGVESNVAVDWGDRLSDDWAPPGVGCGWIRQPGEQQNTYSQFVSDPIPVEGSKRYEFSAYTGAHRCNVFLYATFHDSNGNIAGYSDSANNLAEMAGGRTLSGYKRLVAFGTAPSNAASVRMRVGKNSTYPGNGDSYVFVTQAMIAQASPGQVEATPWNPGNPGGNFAYLNQLNAANISSYMAAAAIKLAYIDTASIGSLSALTATIGLLRTATSGARMELADNQLRVYDGANNIKLVVGYIGNF